MLSEWLSVFYLFSINNFFALCLIPFFLSPVRKNLILLVTEAPWECFLLNVDGDHGRRQLAHLVSYFAIQCIL
jgi:hypothetical protein